MRPETSSPSEKSKVESAQVEPEELSDEEVVMNLLKANSPIDLNELKAQAGLSNKKWDKAIKGLNHLVGTSFLSPGCH